MRALRRSPVAASVAGAVALAVILAIAVSALPVSGNAEHFGAHMMLATPLGLLLLVALRWWPSPGRAITERLARATLLTGMGVAWVDLLLEATGLSGMQRTGFHKRTRLLIYMLSELLSGRQVSCSPWPARC